MLVPAVSRKGGDPVSHWTRDWFVLRAGMNVVTKKGFPTAKEMNHSEYMF